METQTKPTTAISVFEGTLDRYKQAITNLLGSKYGITPLEFMVKAINAVKKNPELLKCTPQSLYGSILYFAEVGLPFGEGPGPEILVGQQPIRTKPSDTVYDIMINTNDGETQALYEELRYLGL